MKDIVIDSKEFVPTVEQLEQAGFYCWDGVYGNGGGIFFSTSHGWHIGFSHVSNELESNFYGYRFNPVSMEQVLEFSKTIPPFFCVFERDLLELGFELKHKYSFTEAMVKWFDLFKINMKIFRIPKIYFSKYWLHPCGLEAYPIEGKNQEYRWFFAKVNGIYEYYYPKNRDELLSIIEKLSFN